MGRGGHGILKRPGDWTPGICGREEEEEQEGGQGGEEKGEEEESNKPNLKVPEQRKTFTELFNTRFRPPEFSVSPRLPPAPFCDFFSIFQPRMLKTQGTQQRNSPTNVSETKGNLIFSD